MDRSLRQTQAACFGVASSSAEQRKRRVTVFGPAIIVAAAGIGASDIIAASVVGARFGVVLLWAVIVGAALKAVLSEGIGRWQLASGTTLLQGVAAFLPRWVLVLFTVYLGVWAVGVAAALANGCGLAVENLTSGKVSRPWGAVAHVILAAFLVRAGGLGAFTKTMKLLVIAMFVAIVFCAIRSMPPPRPFFEGLLPSIPRGAGPFVLSILGGIGGSVTLLTYNYLPQSQPLRGDRFAVMRFDVITAYSFTALFGMAIVVIASQAFGTAGLPANDSDIISGMARTLGANIGPLGFYLYALGFWAAVVASLLGVWQTTPLLMAECYALLRRLPADRRLAAVSPSSKVFRWGLAGLTVPGVLFAFADRPLALIIGYTIVASLTVPFIAAVLLFLNTTVATANASRRNPWFVNAILILALLLSLGLGVREIGVVLKFW